MLLRAVQIFCKMCGLLDLHTDCFSWKGCYSESDPHSVLVPSKLKISHSMCLAPGIKVCPEGVYISHTLDGMC